MSFVGHYKGLVEKVGVEENLGKVKVRFPHLDGLVSDWLPVVQPLNLGANAWAVPRKDTQVIVVPGESPHAGLEDAVVIGGIYSKVDKPPFDDTQTKVIGLVADDGVEISYDPTASKLTVKAPKEVYVEATDVNVKAENVNVKCDKADVEATTSLKVKAGKIDMEAVGAFSLKAATIDMKCAGALTQTAASVTVTAPTVSVAGNVTVAGNITAGGAGGGAGTVSMAGNINLTGNIAQTGTLAVTSAVIGGKPFATHTHLSAAQGSPTGPPL